MTYHKLHDQHDTILCTPQYAKLYAEAIKSHFPDHRVEPSTMVSHGNAYLVNYGELMKEYEKKSANQNQTA